MTKIDEDKKKEKKSMVEGSLELSSYALAK